MEALVARAQQLLAAGPHNAAPAEVAALHALVWPTREPVCETCRGELGKAYYALQRWVNQHNSSTLSSSAPVKKTTTARFHSDETQYTPHGLGVTYSNTNMTDKAARDILAGDPDAKDFFSVLPPAATAEDEAEDLATSQAATPAAAQAPVAPTTVPADFDYAKLASALVDETERRQAAKHTDDPATQTSTDEVKLSAQPGGQGADGVTSAGSPPASVEVTTSTTAPDEHDDDQDGEKPVRLSRMNKEQLVAAHTTELGSAPDVALTNDELRDALAQHRAGQQDPE
ncbi:MAG: hypothetical protein ACRYFX_07295 [Janthinobacterium lividum]